MAKSDSTSGRDSRLTAVRLTYGMANRSEARKEPMLPQCDVKSLAELDVGTKEAVIPFEAVCQ